MRIMVGLTRPSTGQVTITGRDYRELVNPGLEVGVLLDASAQHAGRTGREILAIAAQTMGLPKSRVTETLARVGLTADEAERRVRNYSLGMRQRLGIAHALLGDPQIMILDEPANGLDPAGIHWMRGLLRDYADRGGTVLLSSHLLHEVEVIADELLVIGRGKIVARGTKDELLQNAGTFVKALDVEALTAALSAAGLSFTRTSSGGLQTDASAEAVGRAVAQTDVVLIELRTADGAGLEEMFLELTSDTQRDTITEGAAA
jgi:ABC-2 type transport system ATP-binding protein